jgi:hypothetical protein
MRPRAAAYRSPVDERPAVAYDVDKPQGVALVVPEQEVCTADEESGREKLNE